MAKKTVASLKKTEAKNFAKVIKPVKNPETGTYSFKIEMVPVDMVREVLSKK